MRNSKALHTKEDRKKTIVISFSSDETKKLQVVVLSELGKGPATKSDETLEQCQGGGGAFSIQKFIMQILGTLNRALRA